MSFATRSIHASCTARATFASPLGAMLLARTEHGLAGVWFEGQKDHPGELSAPEAPDDALLGAAAAQLADYFAARTTRFDLPLDLHGTPFQRSVWQALLGIATGRTCSYGDIARTLSSPQAARAVGAAVGKNPVSVIVPCHRVLGTNGALTGYAGGMERKRALLKLEGVAL
ncbi:MAG: methylated-DNA--[protein]-cysteine S-methyltransferase [Burkholderiales bacterium]|nr:methylated-DNA--[protein]-cysteine S-methyltransferase [Burkholderiales bacterium]